MSRSLFVLGMLLLGPFSSFGFVVKTSHRIQTRLHDAEHHTTVLESQVYNWNASGSFGSLLMQMQNGANETLQEQALDLDHINKAAAAAAAAVLVEEDDATVEGTPSAPPVARSQTDLKAMDWETAKELDAAVVMLSSDVLETPPTLLPLGPLHQAMLMAEQTTRDDNDDEQLLPLNDGPSNEQILTTAFVTFFAFAMVQLFFAPIAGSQAMIGDSVAMFVDSMTYLFNWIAERRKKRFDLKYEGIAEAVEDSDTDPELMRQRRKRAKRKMILRMEIIPPMISVITLMIAIGVVLYRANEVLWVDIAASGASIHGGPNPKLMLLFSSVNLFLDGVNVFCFARAYHLLGYQTYHGSHGVTTTSVCDKGGLLGQSSSFDSDDSPHIELSGYIVAPMPSETRLSLYEGGDHQCNVEQDLEGSATSLASKDRINLNMCSAYTHVFADTLRSIAVIVAASISLLVPSVTPTKADATAALVVTFLILASLVPLARGLFHSVDELLKIRADESCEATKLQLTP